MGNTFSLWERAPCPGRSVIKWKNVSDLLSDYSMARTWPSRAVISVFRHTGFVDSLLNPVHYFARDPANGMKTKVNQSRKSSLADQVINS